jgi:hypothetical protein
VRRAALAALCVVALAAPARAVVLSEDPLDGDSTSAGAAVRLYNLVLRGGPLTSPLAPPGYNPAAVSIAALRPQFEIKRGSGVAFVLHDEIESTASSVPTSLLGGSLSLGEGRSAPLWLPLQWSLDRDTYQLSDRIAWAYARYGSAGLTATVGRQPITLGRGQIWTPEDLIAPFSPLQINTDYKPGADAARLDWAPSDSVTLLAVGAAAEGYDSAALSRLEIAAESLRVGVMAANVRTDWVGGLDVFVDLGAGTDLHGEATATWVTRDERRPWGRRGFGRGLLGVTSELATTLHVTLEGYFNGAGAAGPADYVAELSSPRLAVGESYTVGRAYAGIAADWQIHPLLHAEIVTIANLEDPSAMIAPTLRYNVAENASLVAGAFVPVGRAPDYAAGLTARSEFGMYPELYHLDAKLWF